MNASAADPSKEHPMPDVAQYITVELQTAAGPIDTIAERTAVPELAITPIRSRADGFTGQFGLMHVPTGLALVYGRPYELRNLAERLTHLNWSFTTKEGFDPLQEAARKVVRGWRFTVPDAVEVPVRDGWAVGGKGKGLRRDAIGAATDILADTQHSYDRLHGDDKIPLDLPDPSSPRGVKPNPEFMHYSVRAAQDFGLAYLLLALHRVDPEIADSACAFLTDAWDAGDTVGEWAWSWAAALAQDERPNLPGIPDPVDLAPAPA